MIDEHDHADQAVAFRTYQNMLFRLAPMMGPEADEARLALRSLGVLSEFGFRRSIRERGLLAVCNDLTAAESTIRGLPDVGLSFAVLRAAARYIAREQVSAN